jgi:hypothetical protein
MLGWDNDDNDVTTIATTKLEGYQGLLNDLIT